MKKIHLASLFFLILLIPSALASQLPKKNMTEVLFDEKGDLKVIASTTSAKSDFDFLVGKWNIHNRKLKSRLTGSDEWTEFDAQHEMRRVLAGSANIENITAEVDQQPYEGMGIRLFNPQTKLWSIYWTDSNSGRMDSAVVGSFENGIGIFFGKEEFDGKKVLVKFRWDATDPKKPIWSQAFSADQGKTWEWNWYMYFSESNKDKTLTPDENQNIKVLELRNYLIKPGRRDEFINYFEENFIASQNALGGYVLGQYRIKEFEDNFFWIRGFKDMPARNKFLNDFYLGAYWKSHRTVPNSLLLNNDNVYLLKPLNLKDRLDQPDFSFKTNWFGMEKGIAVVDFYTSNTKLEKLIEFVKKSYLKSLNSSGVENTSFWTSEMTPNEFTILPVFQNKDLLVQITFYKNEFEYQTRMKDLISKMSDEEKGEMSDLVTIKNTLIIYPTDKSFAPGK